MMKCLRLISLLVCVLFVSGCNPFAVETPPEEPPEEDPRPQVIGARTLEDGRKVGGSAKGKIGEEMVSVFFSFTVNRAELAGEFEENKPERSYIYLIIEMTVRSILDRSLPMWADDFPIQWGDGDNDYAYPLEKISDSQMDAEFSLHEGESVTKNLIYEVPAPDGEREYTITYLEYFADDVEGNMFYVSFNLSMD
ncbi:MAG: DUF4352 domain-containing protein [Clostridiales bacterium]|nr:DUF4352 domain-containing protein [Clostridiales bacterium]